MSRDTEEYREKLRSLSFSRLKGSTRKRVVVDDSTGQPVGYHTDHWSGRVDATVTRPQVTPMVEVRRDEQ